ncbi:hypothetical protein BDF20DRAFT_841224 [Mycotypha africana]|uniref:uncharacterized protein n=1 Tax=Mycotypha africana TaxID=64632 RepID=UPI0023017358|nr:uncharacterized protein BDF20DRAFT_841224 [Mycotypha africana]KAI8990858.1 hypothetical protein BDF20DRAFT_841224 [Mycotypha africana]
MRLRIGRILRVTEEKYGKMGSAICQLLISYGKLRSSQVQELSSKQRKDGTEYMSIMTQMALDQFIIPISPAHSRIADVNSNSERTRYGRNVPKILEGKNMEAKESTFLEIKRKSSSEENASSIVASLGIKRKAVDILISGRRKISKDKGVFQSVFHNVKGKGKYNRIENVEYEPDPKVFFAINYEKYNILFRNQIVADLAVSRINRTAGLVLKAIFRYGREEMTSLQEELSPAASPAHIIDILEPEVFQRGDIVLWSQPLETKKSDLEVVKEYIKLLLTDNVTFLKAREELGHKHYSVNLKGAVYFIKRYLVETFITVKFGAVPCRLARILFEKLKLTDQQLQKLAILSIHDVRRELGILLSHGLIEIQEIRTSNTESSPARTTFLYSISFERCCQVLIASIHRAIVNLQQCKEIEITMRKQVTEELTIKNDLLWNIDIPSGIQNNEIVRMEAVLEKIEVSKRRLDEMLMILQDFGF